MSVIKLLDGVVDTVVSKWMTVDDGRIVASVHAAGDFVGSIELRVSNKKADDGDPADSDEYEVIGTITTKGMYYVTPQAYEQYQASYTDTSGTCHLWMKTRAEQQ